MTRLMVVGAINTDLVAQVERAPEAGETVLGGEFGEYGGGKGANQAVAAARSGASVSLYSAVGDDAFGRTRIAALEADGVDLSHTSVIDGVASGVAIIIVEASGENRICDLPGARMQLRPEDVVTAFEAIQPDAILATNELPLDCLRALFGRARAADVPIWFNIAPYSDAARALIPVIETLIVNRGEAEDILGVRGEEYSIADLASGLREQGVDRVVMTLGGDGVIGYEDSSEHVINSITVTPVDTTGAGDTFCGAWAAEMMRGGSFADALHYANRAAALSVTRPGAQSSIPTRSEVERT
ncbi:MAG: ribokinase [Thermomicrobiales bacterium]|nr:ribokinase [Thermomicrobiales bacterium]